MLITNEVCYLPMCYFLTGIFQFKEVSTLFLHKKERQWEGNDLLWLYLISHVLNINEARTPKRFALFYYRGSCLLLYKFCQTGMKGLV